MHGSLLTYKVQPILVFSMHIVHNYEHAKILKGSELNRCKKYRNKPVQLTITSTIISNTHAPLQLCIVVP